LRVDINQKILRGQPLIFGDDFTVPMHSPTSGWIKDIFCDSDFISKDKKKINIVILSDNLDQWIRLKPIVNYEQYTAQTLIKKVHHAGVVGLGGGQFSSAKKLTLSIGKVHTLIVNAVESEPYAISDNSLLCHHIKDILKGCEIISWITKAEIVLIAIQEHHHIIIKKILCAIKNKPSFKICILKNKYPGGSSKVLVKMLTGNEIPYNKHAIDIGCLVFNVSTIYAIKKAIINGEPLIERIVTLFNEKDFVLKNFWVRIGTTIKDFLKEIGLKQQINLNIRSGGFFMGTMIRDLNYSILKQTNSIWVKLDKKDNNIVTTSCIKCGKCSELCPVNLLPQQIYWYAKNNDHQATKKYNVFDCIECNICEKICPSQISLVKYFKKEKQILQNLISEKIFKKSSFLRFKERQKRLSNKKYTMINNNYATHFSVKAKEIDLNNMKKKNFLKQKIRKQIVQEAIKRMNRKK